MEHKNYETELPAGYREAYTVDAKAKKTVILLTLLSLAITAAGIAASFLLIRPTGFLENFSMIKYFIVVAVMLAYIVLHELTHGAAYKLLTHQKLTFGFTFTVAFCGVPQIWVYRRAAIISLLAPFTVFTILFGGAVLLLPDAWDKMYAAVLLGLHVGGCAGDLYDTALYLFRFRDPRTLMQDTGPRQTFYLPEG
jgi:hypothetical protein